MSRLRLSGPDRVLLTAARDGRGTPVVLVHGAGGGLDSWDQVVPYLREHHEVWTYARRGYPPSEPGPGQRTWADHADDLGAVIDACGGTPHVVAGSVGATIALHYAAARPGRVRSLTLFEPPLFAAGPGLQPVLQEYLGLVAAGRSGEAGWVFAHHAARAPESVTGPRPTGRPDGDTDADPDAARAIGADLEAMAADSGDLQRWSAVDVPVLLLQGEHTWDPLPATMDALAAALPAPPARVTLAGQSHFAPHTAPREFAQAVLDFVAALD